MDDFSGRWFTTFGVMLLEQHGARVGGRYRFRGSEGRIDGRVRGRVLRFRYDEPAESGTGEFRLVRHGRFDGNYVPKGAKAPRSWNGHRGWDGLWETGYGRLRLVQDGEHVLGYYTGSGHGGLRGRARGTGLAFRYRERTSAGEGRFALADDGEAFTGEWRRGGARAWHPWNGHRVHARPDFTWLVVLEAYWQKGLAEPEYSFGAMLREFFARSSRVGVRQRFFHDAASLAHWTRELLYLAEPVILLVSSHGLAGGLSVPGGLIDTTRVLENLRHVENLRLLHFSSCLVGKDATRALRGRPFAVSGYTTSVDWSASALLEFAYLDQVLNRGVPPARAAAGLARRKAFGLRFFPARGRERDRKRSR